MRSDSVVWHTDTIEVFTFLTCQYDVQRAKRFIVAKPRPIQQVEVEPVRPWIHLPGSHNLGVFVEQKGIETADLTIPIIMAESMPIDGWHRLGKALLTGVTHLPCVLLTKSESKKVRLS